MSILSMLKNKKIFMKLFFSFMCIFIIPFSILSAITYYVFFNVLETEQNSANINALNQTREILDYNFRDINTLTYQLSKNANIFTYTNNFDVSINEQPLLIKNVIADLSLYKVSKEFFSLTAIYFKDKDMFITPGTAYSSREFYTDVAFSESFGYEQWIQRVKEVNNQTFWQNEYINYGKPNQENVTTFVSPIPVGLGSGSITFIGFINTNKVIQHFNKSFSNKEGFILVFDGKGNSILSSAEFDINKEKINRETNNGEGTFNYINGKEKFIGVYNTSLVTNIKYVYLYPENVFTGKIANVRNMFISFILLLIVIVLVFICILSKKNYKPIEDIITLINKNDDFSTNNLLAKDEYQIIFSKLKNIMSQYDTLKAKMDEQLPVLRSNLLNRILKNYAYDHVQINNDLSSLDIKFNEKYFTVFTVSIDSYDDFLKGNSIDGKDMIFFSIYNVVYEVMSKSFDTYIVETDSDNISVIINFSQSQYDNKIDGLGEKLKFVKDFLENNIHIYISIAVGNICTSYLSLNISYSSAISTLNYIKKLGKHSITYYTDVQTNCDKIFYPTNREIQLINYLKSGNEDATCKLLKEIYCMNFEQSTLSLPMIECLFYNIGSSLLKTLADLNFHNDDIYHECVNAIRLINNNVESSILFKKFLAISQKICVKLNSIRKDNQDTLIKDIISYLEHNYHDPTISLEGVAEHFNMTYTYLCKFFKDLTRYNFIDYLNQLRIEKSKILLKGTNISISEISEKVGYLSSNTYIRVFKKYCLLTPGQYRCKESIDSLNIF